MDTASGTRTGKSCATGTGSSWSVVSHPGADQPDEAMFSVAAISPTDAWAVGESTHPSGTTHRVLEHWDGSQWALYHGRR